MGLLRRFRGAPQQAAGLPERHAGPSRALTVLVPLLAVVICNLDVALLLLVNPESMLGRFRIGLWATLPLSILAAAWAWQLFRNLHREIKRRAEAEMSLRAVVRARDRTLRELREALQRETTLRHELDHRVRNNLAGLVGLVGVYEESGRSAHQLAEAIRGKVAALREVYRLINSTGSERVQLRQLVEGMVLGLVPPQHLRAIEIAGPDETLSSAEASALAMVLQELLTNSLKHGALKTDQGAGVRVAWSVRLCEDDIAIDLEWRESPVEGSGPRPESYHGTGLPLIHGLVETDLRGTAGFSRHGSEWRVALCIKPRPVAEAASALSIQQEILT